MKTTIKLVLLYFAYQLGAGLILGGLSHLWPIDQTTLLVSTLALSAGAMTTHLIGFGYINLRQALRPVGADAMLCSMVCAIGAIMCCNALSGIIILPDWLESDFTALSHSIPGIVCICLLAPWVEELLFRGVIMNRLNRQGKDPWRGILLSALMFGLIHVNPVQVFFGFLMGIALGWIAWHTRSLWPAIVAHALNNTMSVAEILSADTPTQRLDYSVLPITTLLTIAVVGLAMAILTGAQLPSQLPLDEEINDN